MRSFRLFPILLMVLGLVLLTACVTEPGAEVAPPAAEEAGPGVEAEGVDPAIEQEAQEFEAQMDMLESFTVEQREEFESQIRTLAQEYDVRIMDLEAQAAQLDETTRAELDQQISQLRQQRDLIQQQIDQIATVTDEEWQNMKTGIMTSIEAFERSFEAAEDDL